MSQRTEKVVEIGKRIVAGVIGAVNIYVGSQKIKASAALATASTVDGPAAVATGTGAVYLGVNGTGQVMTGAANLTYAITGSRKAEEAAQVLTATTTVSGAATLAKTGNVPLAAMVGNSENMVGSVQNLLESKGMMEIINSSVESFLNYISADQQQQQGSHP